MNVFSWLGWILFTFLIGFIGGGLTVLKGVKAGALKEKRNDDSGNK